MTSSVYRWCIWGQSCPAASVRHQKDPVHGLVLFHFDISRIHGSRFTAGQCPLTLPTRARDFSITWCRAPSPHLLFHLKLRFSVIKELKYLQKPLHGVTVRSHHGDFISRYCVRSIWGFAVQKGIWWGTQQSLAVILPHMDFISLYFPNACQRWSLNGPKLWGRRHGLNLHFFPN